MEAHTDLLAKIMLTFMGTSNNHRRGTKIRTCAPLLPKQVR